jgi:hypothetical protein
VAEIVIPGRRSVVTCPGLLSGRPGGTSPKSGAQTERLGSDVRMIGNMQERRNSLALRHVRYCGVFAKFFRRVAELLAMPESRLRLAMDPDTRILRLDNRRHVIGIAINRHAANEVGEREPFRLQVALRAQQRRQLPPAERPVCYGLIRRKNCGAPALGQFVELRLSVSGWSSHGPVMLLLV